MNYTIIINPAYYIDNYINTPLKIKRRRHASLTKCVLFVYINLVPRREQFSYSHGK